MIKIGKDIHDNIIIKYTVDFEKEEIVMETVNYHKEKILIKFDGVLVHYFEMAMPDSIIFNIDEYEGREVIKEKRELLKNTKAFCWPLAYENENDLIKKLEGYKYYIINSSSGLTGWVLAKTMTIL